MMKRIWGTILLGIGKVIDGLLTLLIFIFQLISDMTDVVISFLVSILAAACSFLLILPLLFIPIINSPIFLIIAVIVLIPIITKPLLYILKKYQYALTNYFYDKSEAVIAGRQHSKRVGEYARDYDLQQQRKTREARQQQWETIFGDMFGRRPNSGQSKGGQQSSRTGGTYGPNFGGFDWRDFGNFQQGGYNPGGYSQGGYEGYQRRQEASNVFTFKSDYENNARILEVPLTASYNDIKRAYRKLAKKYHPDVNKQPGANAKFTQITDAYNFFSEDKVAQYKRMSA